MKKQIQKLTLAKETLRKLNENDIKAVLGGINGTVTYGMDCGTITC